MGITGNFLTLIKAMYKNITCQVNINGKLSNKIIIERSVRQGCSISMLLFVLSSTPIINMILENKNINGFITKYGNEIKLLAYADDTTLMVRDPKSIRNIFDEYNAYAEASEAKINVEKTEILLLGSWRRKPPNLGEFEEYKRKEVKILGALFHEDREQTTKINWEKKQEKILKIIKTHEKREISLFGKILIINTIIFSQFWHIGAILQVEDKYIKKIYTLLNKWLNGQNGQNIIQKIMKPKEVGGASLINLKERLQAIKIKARGFIITGDWEAEQEPIVYWAGTRTKTLGNMDVEGPRCERCQNYNEITFRHMIQNKEELKQINKMKVKDIQKVIYKHDEGKCDILNIYKGRNTKFVSLNFRIATNTLKTAVNRDDKDRSCIFCKGRNETIYHLFLECICLEDVRTDLKAYVEAIRSTEAQINWQYVINMDGLEKKFEYEIITMYKKAIWLHVCNVRFKEEEPNIFRIRGNYERDVRFYLKCIRDVNEDM